MKLGQLIEYNNFFFFLKKKALYEIKESDL